MFPSDNFAVINYDHRIWAVGAVHGEVSKLNSIHRQIAQNYEAGDCIVYLGNFTGVGSSVLATINEMLLFRRALVASPGASCDDVIYLRGFQEEMWHKLLQIQFAPNPYEVFRWMLDKGLGSTISAYGVDPEDGLRLTEKGTVALTRWTAGLRRIISEADGHSEIMASLKHAAYTEDKALFFVSAGIDPSKTTKEQTDAFWWSHPRFDRKPKNNTEFSTIVRGFNSLNKKVEIGEEIVSVDSGCGFDGDLTAVLFDADRKPVKVISS